MEKVRFKQVEVVKKIADKVFKEQMEKILGKLPIAQVHHIGSTAIPGSITKGDLDVNVRVNKENFGQAKEILKQMYEINQPLNWTRNFASFKTDKIEIDFGIQLTVKGSKDDVYIRSRDILLSHSELVHELNELKRKYEGKSMVRYRKEKGKFFESKVLTPRNSERW